MLIDPASVTSAQVLGTGNLNGQPMPVVRLFFDNDRTEDVFDVGRTWSK